MNNSGVISLGEARTGIGQHVNFECPADEGERVREFFQSYVRKISMPGTHKVQVEHGWYGAYTRYDISQRTYAGGHGGFIEVLEVKNPPDNRRGHILYAYEVLGGSTFSEWESTNDALKGFEMYMRRDHRREFPKMRGFIRLVECGGLEPWFYAVGDEVLIGDYAISSGLEDDPVYRLGKKFVVDEEGLPEIKTCMGSRFTTKDIDTRFSRAHERRTVPCRLVYWDDGSTWTDYFDESVPRPRPLGDDQLWIVEAVAKFRELLVGKEKSFAFTFTDGNRFVGRIVPSAKHKKISADGDYLVAVTFAAGTEKKQEGWVKDFKATGEYPDIVQYVTKKLAKNGKIVERIEVKKHKLSKNGKKWSGVYFRFAH